MQQKGVILEEYFYILKKCKLFENIKEKEIFSLFHCLNYRIKSYFKNEMIISTGEEIHSIGILLSGTLHITKEDFDGNTSIISTIKEPELFGESFIFANLTTSPITISAVTNSTIMFLSPQSLLNSCSSNCSFHTQLIANSLKIIATKNIELNDKLELLSQKTIRDKIIFYLTRESKKHNSFSFYIPYNRNELSNFIGVERSALSRELSYMKKDGKIIYEKNYFTILNT